MGKSRKKKKTEPKYATVHQQFTSEAELDFHDFGVINDFDIEKFLNEFLEDSHIAGHENLLIIVGKGEIVRPKVKQLLSNHQLVSSFKQAGYFNGQDGAFEVTLSV